MRNEVRSNTHEIKAKAEKAFQDHFRKDYLCDSGSAAADCIFSVFFSWLGNYIHFVYAIYVLVSASVVIAILNRPMDSSFKMAWIIPVLLIPIFGIILYVFVQLQFQTRALARRVSRSVEKTRPYLIQDPDVQKQLRLASVRGSRLVDYMNHIAGFPVYKNTAAKFFPFGRRYV